MSLSPEEEDKYIKLLLKYKDVFAWSYKEMPDFDPKVAVHWLAIKESISPKKQSQRRFRPELILEIETEVNKLIEVDFIREVVSHMDCKHCPSKKEEWTTPRMR